MNDILAQKLSEAITNKRNDVNTYTWRGARDVTTREQSEIRLVDATPDQLKRFYSHCNSMLYSKDRNNPGRIVLLDIIHDQQRRCRAELYLRMMENPVNETIPRYPRLTYLQHLKEFLDKNADQVPRTTWKTEPISTVAAVPQEYADLTIDMIMDACLDQLGLFNRKHITLTFIADMGLWFTEEEIKDYFSQKDELTGKMRDKLEVVRESLGIKPSTGITLKINPRGGLTFEEFRAIYKLHNNTKYRDMSTLQLTTLCNKVLFRLEVKVNKHIDQWTKRRDQIKEVAKLKGISLD